jgi:hypothetical protein
MLLLRCQQRSRLHLLDRAASYGWLKTQSIRSIPQGAKMAEAPRDSGRVALRWWRRWPGWIGYAAVAWSLVYGILGLYWILGGAAFPFGSMRVALDAFTLAPIHRSAWKVNARKFTLDYARWHHEERV